ncbi:MAG: SWIM zinc finger family protein [Endomicrobium sp.]|jgi:hypothetical protein|nr:SWIM zinc finger family protein [Endomicrobium sp.]
MSKIHNLRQSAQNVWEARYFGNYGEYSIKLVLDEQLVLKEYSCSCPSDRLPCKHIFFMLDEIKIKKDSLDNVADKNANLVSAILQNISFDELRKFIIDEAKFSEELTRSILLNFSDKLQRNSGENIYSDILRKDFASIEIYEDEDHYQDQYYSVDLDIVEQWFEKASEFAKQENFLDAEAICKAAIEEYAAWLSVIESEIKEYIDCNFQKDFFDLLKIMAKNGRIDKMALYDYCQNEIKKKKYEGLESFDYFNDLAAEFAADIDPAGFIALQTNLLEKNGNASSYKAERILRRLIDFYTATDQKDKVEKLIDENLQIDEFRKLAVEKRIAAANYGDAKEMLNEKLKNCSEWNSKEWKKLLLEIAQKENDTASIRKLTLEFLQKEFSKQYFEIYKSTFSNNKWETAFEDLYKYYADASNTYMIFKFYTAEVLLYENKIELLIEYFDKCRSLELMEKYYGHIAQKFPEKTLELFKKAMDYYAKNNLGREYYEYIAKILKIIQKISGGIQFADNIISEYRITYKTRRAMMEILTQKFH